MEVMCFVANLDSDLRKSPEVHHALQVWTSFASGDYYRFFKLYKAAPNMSAYLMDNLADALREKAIKSLIKAYKLKYPLEKLLEILVYPSKEYILPLLKARKVVVTDDHRFVDLNATHARLAPAVGPPRPAALTANPRPSPTTEEKDWKTAVATLEASVARARAMSDAAERAEAAKRLLKSCKRLLKTPRFDPAVANRLQELLEEVRGMKKKSIKAKKAEKEKEKNKKPKKKKKKKS
uniref:SAC3/GANP/THP3 conserved domain-containing protein n=1 Tax=Lotharella oceanica TaxID=641309 RepID=A0A7S2XF49_9EUKA